MKTTRSIHSALLACLGAGVLVASQAQAQTIRYQNSGDYFLVGNPGWQAGGTGPGGVPGAGNVIRFNWGNNTVTLAGAAPNVTRFEMGVDESGGLVVNSGGSITQTEGRIGNNAGSGGTALTTGFLTINAGGAVTNLGNHLRLGVTTSTAMGNLKGVLTINGGFLTNSGHLWVGAASNSIGTVTITNGGICNVGQNFGLGTGNATVASGGKGFVYVGDGGVLNLANISATNSIQTNSALDISGSGTVTITGDHASKIEYYTNVARITAYNGLGTVGIDYNNTNVGKTTLWAIAPLVGPPTNCVWNPALNVGDTNGLWNVSTNWDVAAVPASVTKVQFKVLDAIPCIVTNAAVAGQVVIGDGGPGGALILTNGGSLTTGGGIWSAVGYNSNALMIVNSGSSASFGSHLWVGLNSGADGTLVIDGGTVNVGGTFGMGTGALDAVGRCYVTNGGVLNITTWVDFGSVVGSSVLDVSGTGRVIINGNKKISVEADVMSNRITAAGGAGTVVVDYNNINVGKTTIYALGASFVPQQAVWDTSLNLGDTDGLWTVSTNWTGGFVPGSATRARFNIEGALPCTLTTSAVAGRLNMGETTGSGGSLTITNGATLTIGSSDWSSIAYHSNAVVRVENGCTLSFGYQLWIGYSPDSDGTLIINTGTVNVASMIGLGWSGGKGTVQVNDGTLNLAQLNPTNSIKGSSLLNITGTGKVYITGDHLTSVSNYVAGGKITANGGPTVYYAYNSGTNITTISATPLALPPPPSQTITAVSVSGTDLTLTYQTTAGHTYHLESTPSLAPPAWTPVPASTTNATGAPVTFVIPVTPGTNAMFFRTVSP